MSLCRQRIHVESDFSVDMDVYVIERNSKVEEYTLIKVKEYVNIDDYLFNTLLLWLFHMANKEADFKNYMLDVLSDRVKDYTYNDYNRIKQEIENIKDTDTVLDCLDQILLIQNMFNSDIKNEDIKVMVSPTEEVVDELKHFIQRATFAYSVFQERDTTILPEEVAQSDKVSFKYSFHDLAETEPTYELYQWDRPTLAEFNGSKFTFLEEFAIVYNVLYDKWFIWSK